jgi:hypothetical protein
VSCISFTLNRNRMNWPPKKTAHKKQKQLKQRDYA